MNWFLKFSYATSLTQSGNAGQCSIDTDTDSAGSDGCTGDGIQFATVLGNGNAAALAVALKNAEQIKEETLSDSITEGNLQFSKSWNINGEEVVSDSKR